MIVLDTSVLVDALTGPRRSLGALRALISDGERLILPTLGLYEWLRGPREEHERSTQADLLPSDAFAPFGPEEASVAAWLYRTVSRARGREVDLAIAATALVREAELWTLNTRDFADIPELRLVAQVG